jgi:hypothetical protein
MTQKEAKELTLELWRYLAKHPECYEKRMVPPELYGKVMNLYKRCPLCELFECFCRKCPLYKSGEGCLEKKGSAYHRWANSYDNYLSRRDAAERIVEIVSAWEPEGER